MEDILKNNQQNTTNQKDNQWNKHCTQCGATNPKNYSYAVCKSCLEKGKEAGWFDANW